MLSILEIRNSIYLDFEGEGKKRNGIVSKPHIAGLFRQKKRVKVENIHASSLKKIGSQFLMVLRLQKF